VVQTDDLSINGKVKLCIAVYFYASPEEYELVGEVLGPKGQVFTSIQNSLVLASRT
jgi:hypothetical protein